MTQRDDLEPVGGLGTAAAKGGSVKSRREHYEYLFAKKDHANIELLAFRLLASSYAGLTEQQVSQLLVNGDFVEICHDDKTEIQK